MSTGGAQAKVRLPPAAAVAASCSGADGAENAAVDTAMPLRPGEPAALVGVTAMQRSVSAGRLAMRSDVVPPTSVMVVKPCEEDSY